MLILCRRLWTNVKSTPSQHLGFAGEYWGGGGLFNDAKNKQQYMQ